MGPYDTSFQSLQNLENQLSQYEHDLDELSRHGDALIAIDPAGVLPLELSTLHSYWTDLQHQVGKMESEWLV